MKTLLSTLFISCLGMTAFGQVVINEYSCSNISGPIDATGDNNDWAELYNAGAAYSLDGHYLSDDETNLAKWPIPAGQTVPAGGYSMVYFSKADMVSGAEIHTNFNLTQCKNEWIILSDASGVVVDSLNIQKLTYEDNSVARTTDGAATWGICQLPTPNAANTSVIGWYSGKPTADLPAGFYAGTQNVTLTTTDAGATIYYTLDGTTPDLLSTVYSGPISITTTTVLRFFADNPDPNIPSSHVETNTYFIDVNHSMPVLSISGDQITPFLNNTAAGAFSSNFDGHFEFFETDGSLADEGKGYFNKHGNDSWAYAQRGFDFVMRDQYGTAHAVEHQVFPQKNRDEYQRLVIKAAANDNYSFSGGAHLRDALVHTVSQLGDMRMDERTSIFAVVYVDGVYWGLYDAREKVDDHDFTDHYYNQPEGDISFLKTWGATWEEYSPAPGVAQGDWDALRTYITTNDMTVTANYEYVKSVYNVGSLIDYVVLNSVIVTSDWLNWNTAWWHGHIPPPEGDKHKWRYVLWDNDASWGHYINYTGIPSTAPDADPCNPESLPDPGGQGHITILNELYNNAEFKQDYITRYIDLFNGILGCPELQPIVDSFVVVMAPEMTGQTATWGGTVPGWNTNVTTLKDYIDDRCDAIVEGLKNCYNLTGPFNLTVEVDPPGAGQVKVNSIWVSPYPWTGTAYGGIATEFTANDFSGYDFDYWSSDVLTFTQPDSLEDTLDITEDVVVTAHFTEVGTPGVPPPATYTGFHLPNAFSPNGDNNNDWLQYFAGNDVEEFDLKIFDRWGNMVFQTSANGNYWDGYYKGKLLNSGIYTYTLDYTLTDIGAQEETGNITLIR